MSYGLEFFVWPCPENGYAWETAKSMLSYDEDPRGLDAAETRFLVARPMESPRVRHVNPLVAQPALYHTFADLDPTEEQFAAFASEHGALGISRFLNKSGGLPEIVGEPL